MAHFLKKCGTEEIFAKKSFKTIHFASDASSIINTLNEAMEVS